MNMKYFLAPVYGTNMYKLGLALLSKLAQEGKHPLCLDKHFICEIDFLITFCRCDLIVETGTLFGHSTEYFARQYPHLPIYSCELIGAYYEAARNLLEKYTNVILFNHDSPTFLKLLMEQKLHKHIPFIFLDAHNPPIAGYKGSPLVEELEILSKQPQSVICIHDFKVPFDTRFCFDTYKETGDLQEELIKPVLDKFPDYAIYYPHINSIEGVEDLRGRIYIVSGMNEETRMVLEHFSNEHKIFMD